MNPNKIVAIIIDQPADNATIFLVAAIETARQKTKGRKMADFTKTTIWTGKTFEIRAQLKDLGAKWDGATKSWTLEPVGRHELVPTQRLALRAGVVVENAGEGAK